MQAANPVFRWHLRDTTIVRQLEWVERNPPPPFDPLLMINFQARLAIQNHTQQTPTTASSVTAVAPQESDDEVDMDLESDHDEASPVLPPKDSCSEGSDGEVSMVISDDDQEGGIEKKGDQYEEQENEAPAQAPLDFSYAPLISSLLQEPPGLPEDWPTSEYDPETDREKEFWESQVDPSDNPILLKPRP